eukprot:PRCOL_00003705-RA
MPAAAQTRTAQAAPSLPLPPPILSNVPGTWAYDTMSRRVRDAILARLYDDNPDLTDAQLGKLRALEVELESAASTPLAHVPDDGGPDVQVWREIMEPHVGTSWLDAPWVVSEFYLYRRILAAVEWFQTGFDPFQKQKDEGLRAAAVATAALAARANAAAAPGEAASASSVELLLLLALWGNRMDLSLWPAGGEDGAPDSGARAAAAVEEALAAGSEMLLWDDALAVAERIAGARAAAPEGGCRVDIIVDNAGFELVCDLALADHLAATGAADEIVIHAKGHPTFVSDAMEKDVAATVAALSVSDDAGVAAMGARWADHLAMGRWRVREDCFWAQPTPMWEMPEEVRELLAGSTMIFVKGDANYRRLLGERDWALDAPFDGVVSYFPAPVCALRTLKAELGCGMEPARIERAKQSSPDDWMVAGKYGCVQLGSAPE